MTKAEMEKEEKRKIEASELMMRYLGLEVDEFGYIVTTDDDGEIESRINIAGKLCKHPLYQIDNPKKEIAMDIYNNLKFCSNLVYFYNKSHNYVVQMMYLTNTKMDTTGRFVIEYGDGNKFASDVYCKDSLKYIDFIMKLENALPQDFKHLRELDIDVPFK